MNTYSNDSTLFDFANFSNQMIYPISVFDPSYVQARSSSSSPSSSTICQEDRYAQDIQSNCGDKISDQTWLSSRKSPPKHRHDGKSPLPLGMDWSFPPFEWDGQHTIWPHNPHSGWSYSVTIPSWIILPLPRDLNPRVFYRVQVGIQSPKGVTTTIGVLRRFNDFLNLLSDLKKLFPRKALPPAPPKRVLRYKNQALLEERRSYLEDWIEKLLSDIDVSRSAPIGAFLELETAARSAFDVSSQQNSSVDDSLESVAFPSMKFENNRVDCEVAGISRMPTDDLPEARADAAITESQCGEETMSMLDWSKALGLGTDRFVGDDLLSVPDGELSSKIDASVGSDLHFLKNSVFVLPSNQHHKLSRVLDALWQRLSMARSDMEDLIARLNQETSMRKFLSTKINDLEVDLETTRSSYKDNIKQSISMEKEKFTQLRWDVEELRKQLLEADLKLKYEQQANSELEAAKHSIFQKNRILQQQLDQSREEVEELHKHYEELEMKSKADVRVLVKEVKSLRISRSDLKRELSCLMKEKFEAERICQKEKQMTDRRNDTNAKLLRECELLLGRLRECSVDLVIEDEIKLSFDASSPCEAVDLLATSDNRIGLLLAEAQLLAQDLEIPCTVSEAAVSHADDDLTTDVRLKKMLTELCVDNAKLRMLINSVSRCALKDRVDSDEASGDLDEPSLSIPVLSKFLE